MSLSSASAPIPPHGIAMSSNRQSPALVAFVALATAVCAWAVLIAVVPRSASGLSESASGATSCAGPAGNVVRNPGFEQRKDRWTFVTNGRGGFTTTTANPYTCLRAGQVTIRAKGTNVQLFQKSIALLPATAYRLTLAARSSGGRDVQVLLGKNTSPFTDYGLPGVTLDLTPNWQVFTIDFVTRNLTTPVNDGRLRFSLNASNVAGEVYYFDEVSLLPLTTVVPTATATRTPTSTATVTSTATPVGTPTPTRTPSLSGIGLQSFASGLTWPVGVVNSGVPGDRRLFAIERAGRVRIINADGSVQEAPFLDISQRVSLLRNTLGLLGIVFHPDYSTNGYFYVYYMATVDGVPYSRVARYQVSPNDPNIADVASESVLLAEPYPVAATQVDHVAGDMHFGPDGYLYVAIGDGNLPAVITGAAQELGGLRGKLLRLDVDMNGLPAACPGAGNGNYTIPSTNPYAGVQGSCGEIWAFGLRNPWRFSFDSAGNLYILDVGRDVSDEIDFQAAGASGGRNYGWPCYEANSAHAPSTFGCPQNPAVFTFPVIALPLDVDADCSGIGGYVYEGAAYPILRNRYVFADWCSGNFSAAEPGSWSLRKYLSVAPRGIVALGEDIDGELYAVHGSNGTIQRIVAIAGP